MARYPYLMDHHRGLNFDCYEYQYHPDLAVHLGRGHISEEKKTIKPRAERPSPIPKSDEIYQTSPGSFNGKGTWCAFSFMSLYFPQMEDPNGHIKLIFKLNLL